MDVTDFVGLGVFTNPMDGKNQLETRRPVCDSRHTVLQESLHGEEKGYGHRR